MIWVLHFKCHGRKPVGIYYQIKQREKEKEILEQGVELAKKIPAGPAKQMIEANLYRGLGWVYLIQREADKAIEYISYSLQARESHLAFLKWRGHRQGRSSSSNES